MHNAKQWVFLAAIVSAALPASALARQCGTGDWVLRSVTGPTPRASVAMAFDSARGRTVVYGGVNQAGLFTDTWEWDGSAWQQALIAGPDARGGSAMVFDSARAQCVLVGGQVPNGSYSSQTWEYDGSVWVLRTDLVGSPGSRGDFGMAYDSARSQVVVFGGKTTGGGIASTKLYNGTSWTSPSVNSDPAARSGNTLCFDSARSRVVMYGGSLLKSDAWEWTGTGWTLRSLTGPVRVGGAYAFDIASGTTRLFTGRVSTSADPLEDAWSWNGTVWAAQPELGPGPRIDSRAVFDSARGVIVLFGGFNGVTYEGDTWEWSFASTPRVTSDPASALAHVGESISLSVTASGGGGSYHWRRAGVALVDDGRIMGSQSSTLTIAPATLTDAGNYDVQITNNCGSTYSAVAQVTVSPTCPTDTNGDGIINTIDLAALLSKFGMTCP